MNQEDIYIHKGLHAITTQPPDRSTSPEEAFSLKELNPAKHIISYLHPREKEMKYPLSSGPDRKG